MRKTIKQWFKNIQYLDGEVNVERDEEGEQENLDDVLADVHVMDNIRSLQGHAHLVIFLSGKCYRLSNLMFWFYPDLSLLQFHR